ncbi:hypothetical protein BT96DRAFT_999787 [Gymnopus androsaceus JB14]|uniref:Mid2 domain-containing protein n=1 Tax=Gymnopus androsaceus JB14 TaxID=1447944 RepID=A0A6A4H5L3_9AGAR|nr:hypothetical protein BT96DRAFT_999787 [Gymnopus androsaceus JB14]
MPSPSPNSFLIFSTLTLATLILPHITLQARAFSFAIPSNPIQNISFPVIWQRDSTDPTMFSLDRQWKDPSTNKSKGGGIFAEINGTVGESLDPQTSSLQLAESGTFIMYGLVTRSPHTKSTFYISPTFTVLGSLEAVQTTGIIYLGTSFPLAGPTSSSISSSSLAGSGSSAPTAVSTVSGASDPTSSTSSSLDHSSDNTAAIIGGVVGGVIVVFAIAVFTILLRRQNRKLRYKKLSAALLKNGWRQ